MLTALALLFALHSNTAKAGMRDCLANFIWEDRPEIQARLNREPPVVGSAGLLFYPHYPDHPSLTHTKVEVNDEGYTTMGIYEHVGSLPVLRRLARKDLRKNFVHIEVLLDPDEREVVKRIVSSEGPSHPFCITGSCLAF